MEINDGNVDIVEQALSVIEWNKELASPFEKRRPCPENIVVELSKNSKIPEDRLREGRIHGGEWVYIAKALVNMNWTFTE